MKGHSRLLQIAQALDDDPWRQRLRRIRVAGRSDRSQVDLRSLSQDSGIANQPAACLVILSRYLRQIGAVSVAADLIQNAQRRHPDDLNLAFEVGTCRMDQQPPKPADAIRYFSVAEALRPSSNALVQMRSDGHFIATANCPRLNRCFAGRQKPTPITGGLTLIWAACSTIKSTGPRRSPPFKSLRFASRQPTALERFRHGDARPKAGARSGSPRARPRNSGRAMLAAGKASANVGDQAAAGQFEKLPEAIAVLKKATGLNPNLAFAHFDLGKAWPAKKDRRSRSGAATGCGTPSQH